MHQQKIPTVLGLILVIGAIMLFQFAFTRVNPLFSRASTSLAPQEVTVTNSTDTSFTVSWVTEEAVTGQIIIDGSPKRTVFDERDAFAQTPQNQPVKYTTHSVTIRNLKPQTEYRFNILSGGKSFQHNDALYTTTTAPTIDGVGSNLEPAYGQIVLPTDKPAEGAIVYLTPDGGQTVSTVVKSSGSWVIPLNLIRTNDLSTYVSNQERINESIVVRSAEGEASALTDTLNDNPVPIMTIGKTYDFRKIQAEQISKRTLTLAPVTPTTNPIVLGSNITTTQMVAITKPLQNAAVSSNLPLIQGTGVPGKQIMIIVGIQNPTTGTVMVGTDGVWYYTPSKRLTEGRQSVTITTQDKNGKTVAITHAFQVLKSGTQVLGDATPSATIAPTPTTFEEPTPTATLSGEPIPETGTSFPLTVMLILGTVLVSSGIFYGRRYT